MTVVPTSDGRSTMYAIGDWAAVNNGAPYVDANRVWWRVTREEGWQGSTDPRVAEAPLPGGDGQVSGPVNFTARTVTLGGQIFAPDQQRLQAAMDQASALLAGTVRADTLVVAEAHTTRQTLVRLAAKTDVAKQSPYQATFVMQLKADDPVRYGADLRTASATLMNQSGGTGQKAYPYSYPYDFGGPGVGAGQMVVVNNGQVMTWPTTTITGPGANLRLEDQASGNVLIITQLLDGQFVVLDHRRHRVLLQGVQPARYLLGPGSAWFGFPKGTDVVTFSAPAFTSATVSMTWRDAT